MKTVTVPFDLEMAKKIQSGEVKGKIVDKIGIEYEIVKYDALEEQLTIARLGCMRVWNLKQKLVDIMHDNESHKSRS